MRFNFLISSFILAGLLSVQSNCSKNNGADTTNGNNNNDNNNNNTSGASISSWITKGDQSVLLQKQTDIKFDKVSNPYQNIDVDSTQTFQVIDGFGYTLTGGSAYLINQLGATEKILCCRNYLERGKIP